MLGLHHNRKSMSEDFVEAVSGTHGLAGAADTVVVIKRQRNETAAHLLVTGRDVEEAEYGMRIHDGTTWGIDGPDLLIAAERAETARATMNLGIGRPRLFICAAHPEGIGASAVADEIGMPIAETRVYLGRLVSSERNHRRLERGVYGPAVSHARAHARTGVISVTSSTEITDITHVTGGTTTPKNRRKFTFSASHLADCYETAGRNRYNRAARDSLGGKLMNCHACPRTDTRFYANGYSCPDPHPRRHRRPTPKLSSIHSPPPKPYSPSAASNTTSCSTTPA